MIIWIISSKIFLNYIINYLKFDINYIYLFINYSFEICGIWKWLNAIWKCALHLDKCSKPPTPPETWNFLGISFKSCVSPIKGAPVSRTYVVTGTFVHFGRLSSGADYNKNKSLSICEKQFSEQGIIRNLLLFLCTLTHRSFCLNFFDV